MITRRISLGALALGAWLTAGGAWAQRSPDAAASRRDLQRQRHMRSEAERLRAALQIRPEQETALMSYVAALHPPRLASPRPPRGTPTLQRLEMEQARRLERLEVWKRQADATRSFYAQLAPEQRRAFDNLEPDDED